MCTLTRVTSSGAEDDGTLCCLSSYGLGWIGPTYFALYTSGAPRSHAPPVPQLTLIAVSSTTNEVCFSKSSAPVNFSWIVCPKYGVSSKLCCT